MSYSITLNFFIPKEITQRLKAIHLEEGYLFDWRAENLCHCTIKAIALCEQIPSAVEDWSAAAEEIFSTQSSFHVLVQNIGVFPTAIYSEVASPDLLSLHKKLCKRLPSSQPHFEGENFSPHISLAMTQAPASVYKSVIPFGGFWVQKVELMIWNLKDLTQSKTFKTFHLQR